MISRRRFLQSSTAITASSALALPRTVVAADNPVRPVGRRPRHIIHMVADGMSMGTLTCADHLSQLLRQKRGLTWTSLMNNPAVSGAWVNMRSLNSLVTDSAAAASSWGSGSRVINGAINQLPDGRDLKTLYELFGGIGWKRGLVTTTEITHATPAGFAANVGDRETGAKIALQYLERKIEVLLGGGQKFFDWKVRRDRRDLKEEYRRAGYRVMETKEDLLLAPKDARWLGIFDKSHLPFTVDHVNDSALQARVPTLAEMTGAALSWLGQHEHFILQVEGGRVDQACHNCDAVSALRDQVAFDEAIDIALAFQRRVPDTLVVITTDHGNGNPGLNGMGTAYTNSSFLFDNIVDVKMSFPKLLDHLRTVERINLDPTTPRAAEARDPAEAGTDDPEEDERKDDDATAVATDPTDAAEDEETPAERRRRRRARTRERITVASTREIMEAIEAGTGYKVSARRVEMLIPFLARKGRTLYDLMNNETSQLGQLMANYVGIGWTGHSHTADYVPLNALGPGAELFRGFMQNTDVFHHYLALAGIDFRNPTEPLVAENDLPRAAVEENVEEYKLA
jgi:alkaline phosphatase